MPFPVEMEHGFFVNSLLTPIGKLFESDALQSSYLKFFKEMPDAHWSMANTENSFVRECEVKNSFVRTGKSIVSFSRMVSI